MDDTTTDTEPASVSKQKGRFKTHTVILERQVTKLKRQLEILTRSETRSRQVWTKAYHSFINAVQQLTELKQHGTKKEAALKKKIRDWPAQTTKLTHVRDELRDEIKKVEKSLIELGTKRAIIMEQQINDVKAIDEIVTQVFDLNAVTVRASADRQACLNRHMFPRLIDEHGNLCSQISFISADGLRKVIALVNTMTLIKGDLATQAKVEIQNFFDRFQKMAKMDKTVLPLYELTRQLLVEKTDFKVGPDLYRFLAMELDAVLFPELSTAQTLLRQSIRSEKTNKYIRIYKRTSRTQNWEVVPQS